MKKIITLVLAVLIMAFAAGCTNDDNDGNVTSSTDGIISTTDDDTTITDRDTTDRDMTTDRDITGNVASVK